MKKLATTLAITLLATSANAAESLKSLSIYGNTEDVINSPMYYNSQNLEGYAFATFERDFEFTKGENKIAITNLPEGVEQSSININKIGSGKTITEQYFLNKTAATADASGLIKGEVTVEQIVGDKIIERKGTLLNSSPIFQNEIALQQADGKIVKINNPAAISYNGLENPNKKSTDEKNIQTWLVNSATAGAEKFEYSYKTAGISWAAEYRLNINEQKEGANTQKASATLQAWANIFNYSGVDYLNTDLKLIAGQVNSTRENQPRAMYKAMAPMAEMSADAKSAPASNFTQNNFSDLQTYTIERKVDLPNQMLKKIKLFEDKPNVNLSREYIVDSNNGGNTVAVQFKLLNKVENGLGQGLPAGKFKVYELDSKTNQNEFIGEATIPQTPAGEKIEVATGNAFSLKSERKIINQVDDQTKKSGFMEVEYELANQKTSDVEITVNETIYQNNWQITASNFKYKKLSANQIQFLVPVKRQNTQKLQFKIEYSW